MKVTKALLKRKGACSAQIKLFAQIFPEGGDVTEAACVEVSDKFDWKGRDARPSSGFHGFSKNYFTRLLTRRLIAGLHNTTRGQNTKGATDDGV